MLQTPLGKWRCWRQLRAALLDGLQHPSRYGLNPKKPWPPLLVPSGGAAATVPDTGVVPEILGCNPKKPQPPLAICTSGAAGVPGAGVVPGALSAATGDIGMGVDLARAAHKGGAMSQVNPEKNETKELLG